MDLASLLNTQNRRLIKLTTPTLEFQELLLENFNGTEGLSLLFNFTLSMLSQDPALELKTLIGKPACLEIELADGGARHVHGYITQFGNSGSQGNLTHYSATLTPWLWMLGKRFNSRIFQNQSIEQVISSVFADYAPLAQYEFRLLGDLPSRSYITQYRESDLNFVLRLLESEGLFFYFEHSADQHTLIITDASNLLKPLPQQPTIRYHSTSINETADSIFRWSGHRQLQSGKIVVQTFDYKQPDHLLPVNLQSLNQQGDVTAYEIYDFPGQYTHASSADGERLVRHRIEALEVQGKIFSGASNCRAMCPGFTFELTQHHEHDRDTIEDRQFQLLTVNHHGSNNYLTGSEAGYENIFTCIRKKIPFRAQPLTHRPTVHGPQTAIVVGPPGEEIFTDDLGRVKVHFHWDRESRGANSQRKKEESSCWVRVSQTSASGGFGSIHIPRVGDEVVVSFLDGQPDRPLITGSVYNSKNTPPWSLPANKTQSGFLTRSTKGSGANANSLLFEDKQGSERISVHAERNMDTEVEYDESLSVGNNRVTNVGGSHTETVKKDAAITVLEGDFTLTTTQQGIHLYGKTTVILQVGNSSIVMTPESIALKADAILIEGSQGTTVQGKTVHINQDS